MKSLISIMIPACALSACATGYSPSFNNEPIDVKPQELDQFWTADEEVERYIQINPEQGCRRLSTEAASDMTVYAHLRIGIDSTGRVYSTRLNATEEFPQPSIASAKTILPYVGYDKIRYQPANTNNDRQPVVVTYPVYFVDCPVNKAGQ
ncbi:MAG: hypothetical protein CMI02_05265 [Oceanospirillaceae bacterium]|nr:hypothetical protein [Oceanospirillaceae bacterium]MBT11427.1 hypothetical protein [Oceanospirillaceae bacterium]|tara:strand:- start:115389 stop:115838 length:450 start_codon:yes stop_codon:yes gene_type:complete